MVVDQRERAGRSVGTPVFSSACHTASRAHAACSDRGGIGPSSTSGVGLPSVGAPAAMGSIGESISVAPGRVAVGAIRAAAAVRVLVGVVVTVRVLVGAIVAVRVPVGPIVAVQVLVGAVVMVRV